jgi:spore germination protein GerM
MFLRRFFSLGILLVIFGAVLTGLFVIKDKNISQQKDTVNVYFYYQERIYPVARKVESGENPIKLALIELLNGPTMEERTRGLQTLLPRQVQIKELALQDGILEIYFNEALLQISGGHSLIEGILSQVVYTATAFKEIKAVKFRIAGKPDGQLVLGGEGYIIDAPLTREYFMGRQ